MSAHPPHHRSRRLTWAALIFILIVAALAGAHWMWSVSAAKSLEQQIAAYKAAGEPIEVGDFAVHGVDEADNAAPDLRAAARMIQLGSDSMLAYEKLEPALPLTNVET